MLRHLIFIAVVGLARAAWAEVDYAKEIKPLLKERCYACHGALKQKAGLRVDTVALMRKGGDSGDIIGPAPALLLGSVTATDKDERMPPEGAPLNAEEIAKLKAWIAAGAPAPANDEPEAGPARALGLPAAEGQRARLDRRAHRRATSRARLAATARSRARGVAASRVSRSHRPAADGGGSARRFVDETHRSQAIAAIMSSSSIACSPRPRTANAGAGTSWTSGATAIGAASAPQLRHSQKHIWHWRDWIVESLNADKGYDQMIVEMLAADETAPEDRDALRATGFLARNYYLFNRTTWLDEVVEHTSRAFLGLTMQCVKCHDHKYDPIAQADYYRMRAIFEPYHVRLDPWPGEAESRERTACRASSTCTSTSRRTGIAAATRRTRTSRARCRPACRRCSPSQSSSRSRSRCRPPPVCRCCCPSCSMINCAPPTREIAQAKIALERLARSWPSCATRSRKTRQHCQSRNRFLDRGAGVGGCGGQAADAPRGRRGGADEICAAESSEYSALLAAAAKADAAYQLARAESELAKARQAALTAPKDKAAEAEKKVKAAEEALATAKKNAANPGEKYTPIRATLKAQEGPEDKNNADFQPYPTTSTGRRLAFAQWIADERNPLTARVLVNHRLDAPLRRIARAGRQRLRPALARRRCIRTCSTRWRSSSWSTAGA